MTRPPATLLLFDIDGTLLDRATRAHWDALHAALRDIHGVDVQGERSPISPAGRTDGEIARALLLGAGVSALRIDERSEAVRDSCCSAFARLCPADLSDKVFPGIPRLLERLAAREDVQLSLVTGNFEPIGRLKLARAGIGKHFLPGQGAFGSDSEDRAALPGIARRRAGSGGIAHPRQHTIVIGDTPRDIACARADGVRCFAMATGPYQAAELTGADAVASGTEELHELLAAASE
jgi:phosphoglycolate phosphatase